MILEEFKELGLSDRTLEALAAKGFETPSPIQRLTIPVMLENRNDIIAQAQTGTGKTAAFGLPIVEQLVPQKKTVQALILAPTRELAIQVNDEIQSFRKGDLRVTPIYGGAAMNEQLRRLNAGVDIVVGTPGRILDHLRRGTLDLSGLKWLVLDE
ncbi:MAG: DEAD/DEAH box helicase, partial [Rikenellaceae bacterium]|nr:DEAD/DEAH box helicase [Rikenellaceae bacterium]